MTSGMPPVTRSARSSAKRRAATAAVSAADKKKKSVAAAVQKAKAQATTTQFRCGCGGREHRVCNGTLPDAAAHLHTACVATLLANATTTTDADKNVDRRTRDGQTALHTVAEAGAGDVNAAAVDIARLLVRAGVDVNAVDDMEQTPLHLAAQGNAVRLTRLLCECGADVTAGDEMQLTPLMRAAMNGHVAVGRVLCVHNRDMIGMRNGDEQTAADVAADEDWPEFVAMVREYSK